MKKIYILLMHTNTIPSKLVRFFTRYEYSHVAISLDEECYTTYSFGRRSLNNILNGGLSIQKKDGEFFNKFNKTKCKIFVIEVKDEEYDKVKQILTNMERNIDKYKYDFFGIIPRFFKLPIIFKNKFVCSYFVAFVLNKANICSFEKETCLMNPKDFDNITGFKQIYIGNYLMYKA